jgi:hypothetical protein
VVYETSEHRIKCTTHAEDSDMLIKCICLIRFSTRELSSGGGKNERISSFYDIDVYMSMRCRPRCKESSTDFLMRDHPLLRDCIDRLFYPSSIHIICIGKDTRSYKYDDHSDHDHEFYECESGCIFESIHRIIVLRRSRSA